MAKKFYVVLNGRGRIPMIYSLWKDCQSMVIGFSGAKFKSFGYIEEAVKFIIENSNTSQEDLIEIVELVGFKKGIVEKAFSDVKKENSEKLEGKTKQKKEKKINVKKIIAYVDGSYSKRLHNYSYGVALLENDALVKTLNGVGDEDGARDMRQVYGELVGAKLAVNYAIEHGFRQISIHYDYAGIEEWGLLRWKRNNVYTQKYSEFIQEKMKEIDIKFVKVLAHSGDRYNDMADSLAKEAFLK